MKRRKAFIISSTGFLSCYEITKKIDPYHLDPHEVQEIVKRDDAGALGVDLGDHLLQLVPLGLEAERPHGDFELSSVDGA